MGLPGRVPADVRSLARQHTTKVINVLAGIALNGKNENARVYACGILLERGWGKAPQSHTGPDGEGDISIVIRHIVEGQPAPKQRALPEPDGS